MDNAQIWIPLVATLIGIGSATLAGVWWVVRHAIRDEVKSILDREFKNGKEPESDGYEPLRAVVDEIRKDLRRFMGLLANHTHNEQGNVVAPVYGDTNGQHERNA